MQLRGYQREAIDACRAAFHARAADGSFSYRNVLLVLPTAAGKTVCFSDVAAKSSACGTRTLILAHRIELIRQASAKLTAAGVPHGVVAPGYPRTDHLVQVASVQTLAMHLGEPWAQNYGLIVPDEAHHSVAGQYLAIFAASPRARILGVTATPLRLDGKGLGRAHGGVFDNIVLGPSIPWLQERGYLCATKIWVPPGGLKGPDLSAVGKSGADYAKAKLAAAMSGKTLVGDAVAHYRKRADGKAAIAFCVNVAHAKLVADTFAAAGYRARAVYGDMPGAERDAAIDGLESGETQVLCSADLISEGLDVPRVECVICLRPTVSLTLFLQQIGRGLRVDARKPFLIVLDHAGNCSRHGDPTEEREWSLEGKTKGGKKPAALRQCPDCYRVHRPAAECPECGHRYAEDAAKRGPRKSLKVIAGELEELSRGTGAEAEATRKRIDDLRKAPLFALLDRVKKYDDLMEIAAARGYKAGWVFRAAQGCGFIGRQAA